MNRSIRTLCSILCLTILSALCFHSPFAISNAESQTISVSFQTSFSSQSTSWGFPYDDAFFLTSADEYQHALARASLGLALASGRAMQDPRDSNILGFLSQAGFSALEGEDYHVETSQNTIASMLGHKQLPNGDTLLVAGISGIGYGNEWLSNLDIGNETDHRGFSTAAEEVAGRIRAYMAKHQLDSSCRLWISGYSRAAAVSNLVAATLMEEGVFKQDRTYVYTFATPRTTRKPLAYPNIFNIVGKFDPATKLPYANWGYGRHGVDLFTPAQETDSSYRQQLQPANVIYTQLTGEPLNNNTEINHNFTIIAEYLTSIIPSAAHYDNHVCEHLQEVWKNPNLSTLRALISVLSTSVELSTLSDMEQKQQVEDLIDYLLGIIYGIASQSFPGNDDEDGKSASALLLEHQPEVYLSWLFSCDDPAALYSDEMNYLHLILDGDADVTLFDQKGGFILTLDTEGEYTEETDVPRYHRRLRPLEDRPLISVSSGTERMIVLPKDQGMPFVIDAQSDGLFSYYGILYHINEVLPTATRVSIIDMKAGEQYLAFSFTPDGMKRMNADHHVWGDADSTASIVQEGKLLSVELTAELEGFGEVSIDLKTIVIIVCIAFVVLLLLLVLLLFLLIRFTCKLIRSFRKKTSCGDDVKTDT